MTSLFLTDSSRIKVARTQCARLRWLEYHAGGYGIRPRKQAVPLTTGIYTHRPLEKILLWVVQNGGSTLPPREVFREIITTDALMPYFNRVRTRGFENTPDTLQQRLIWEQAALIEGLIWGARRVLLPYILENFEVVRVEEEAPVMVVGCTCGLGDRVTPHTAHEQRDCTGVGIMTRGDVVLRRRADGEDVYLDWKTSGNVDAYNWDEEQADGVQFAMNAAALLALGHRITDCVVGGLNKGWREAAKEEDAFGKKRVTAESAKDKKQRSIFCWAYRRPGNPPLVPEEWRASYNYQEVDPQTGALKQRKLTRDFELSPVWEADFPAKPLDWTALEYWVEALPLDLLQKEFKLAGPFPQHTWKQDSILRGVAADEAVWAMKVRAIHAELARAGGALDAPSVIAALDTHAPQSWVCTIYRRKCSMKHICDRGAGWENPLGTGLYELRRPHHQAELEQAQAAGWPIGCEEEDPWGDDGEGD